MVVEITTVESAIGIFQILAAVFTLTYTYDVLVLHRRFKQLGEVLTRYSPYLVVGIFITVLSFVIGGFGKFRPYVDIGQLVGILIIGVYFRKCMHKFFTQPMHVHR